MSKIAFSLLLSSALATIPLRAEPSVGEKAESALRDGFPQAAIAPLKEALRKTSPKGKQPLGLLLARAQLEAGQPSDAQDTLKAFCDRNAAETIVLNAAALAAQGELEEAAKLVTPYAPSSIEAEILLARIRLEQGNASAVATLLPKATEPLPESPDILRLLLDHQIATNDITGAEVTLQAASEHARLPKSELDVARGRVLLAQNRPSEAAESFRLALNNLDIPAPVRDNAHLGLAKALITLGVEGRARDVLHDALDSSPDSPTTCENMALWLNLEKKLGADPSPDLRTWATQSPSRRTFEARLQLAKLDLEIKRADLALVALNELAAAPPANDNDAIRVQLLLAEAHIAAGQIRQALELLDGLTPLNASPQTRFRLADLRGRALAANGEHHQAQEAFSQAIAIAASPEEKASAAANSLVSALAANDLPLARKSFAALQNANPNSGDLIRWAFLIAAAEARNGSMESLATITRRSPAIEYAFQAKLALAEWHLARGDALAAERILRTAHDDAGDNQRAAALAAAEIFTADNAGSLPKEDLLAACLAFLERYPQSPETTDIAFKTAELHSRNGDHAAAESILSNLARTLKDPEAAALAKFLAAQASARSMSADGTARAMTWFDEIAQGTTSLRHRARFEQASILLREKRLQDAITLYDRLLASDISPEVRLAALMEKGDTLFAMGASEPAKFSEAIALYRSITAQPNLPPDWRDQAECKMAAALARDGQIPAALTAYREVLSRPPPETADPFWFHKAGLEAGRLLEEQQDWRAAIAVYDQMAKASGAKHEELQQRARRLRLEHFIWEN